MNLAAVRRALADAMAPVVRSYAYAVDAPQPPCAMVGDASVTLAGLGDKWTYDVPVALMVARITDERSQEAMDTLVSALVDALHAMTDATVGYATVLRIEPYGVVDTAELSVTTATLQVRVTP